MMIKMSRDEPYLRLDGNDTSSKEKENLGQKQMESTGKNTPKH